MNCSCNIGSTTRGLDHWVSCPLFGDTEAALPAAPETDAQRIARKIAARKAA